MAWLDCRKAYDSAQHNAVIRMLKEKLIPRLITFFISTALKNWAIDIYHAGKNVIENKNIGRGIIQ
ncbi:MAG: hypothetical protein MHPSP_003263, partial [Paramarteilia canceri]